MFQYGINQTKCKVMLGKVSQISYSTSSVLLACGFKIDQTFHLVIFFRIMLGSSKTRQIKIGNLKIKANIYTQYKKIQLPKRVPALGMPFFDFINAAPFNTLYFEHVEGYACYGME